MVSWKERKKAESVRSLTLGVAWSDTTPTDIRQAAERVIALTEGTTDYDSIKERVSRFDYGASEFLNRLVEVALNRPMTRADEDAIWSLRWYVRQDCKRVPASPR